MTKSDFFFCIITKLMSVVIMAMGIAYTPYCIWLFCYRAMYFRYVPSIDFSSLLVMIIISISIFGFGFLTILKTNNPLTRYNIFTINRKWKNKMEKSIDQDPGQIYKFDRPDKQEVIQRDRENRLKKLLNN